MLVGSSYGTTIVVVGVQEEVELVELATTKLIPHGGINCAGKLLAIVKVVVGVH